MVGSALVVMNDPKGRPCVCTFGGFYTEVPMKKLTLKTSFRFDQSLYKWVYNGEHELPYACANHRMQLV